jgi:preprotein translocase subunit SecY
MAGTMLLTWIGDLVTEYGVGNGISILIFVGIISSFPMAVLQVVNGLIYGSPAQILGLLLFVLLSLVVVVSVVLVNEGTRNVLIEYGRRSERSQKVTNYLPLKINQAGVIPIIFAVSAVSLPSMISGPFVASSNETLQNIGIFLNSYFSQDSALYNVLYFILVFGFTYFYTSIQFDPVKIADDIKKRGGFIPGIRPGSNTAAYLKGVISRITLSGALFLGTIAVLPYLVRTFTGFGDLSVGGSGLLIVVSVVLETVRQVESLMTVRDYQSFLH